MSTPTIPAGSLTPQGGAIPTVPLFRVTEIVASIPGAAHVPALGMIMAPSTRPGAVGRIVAYVAPPEPIVFKLTDYPLTEDVTEAESNLISYLHTGRTATCPEEATPAQGDQWEREAEELRASLRRFLKATTPKRRRDTPPNPEELPW